MGNLKQPKNPTEKQVIGKIGEDCACKYLKKEGYKIIDRNYLKKWGEIDIVAQKGKKLHFVEVKSVSHVTFKPKTTKTEDVIHETPTYGKKNDSYRPEDNMHPWKLQRLARTIQSYLLEKDVSDETDWQFDVATVYVDMDKRLGKVFLLPDIVL